ncbi:MAG: hypothetical protein JRJ85_27750 [Deltaproteobacteria bacterium]|nr:hypothetical protein [Deltaproteobacteria bacterium]
MTMKKFFGLIAIVAVMTISFVIIPLAGNDVKAADPITLNLVSFVPVADKVEFQTGKRMFIDRVNERSKGELIWGCRCREV